ncbi:Cobalamin adenosyltransferase [Novymonas esmeraldas]|uniref:Cobalamin adenosyltransferase n=1 Tax=Novymonas esmeraldas TaxID=1808958 RepID=A0AAW0F031_9TRYP
MGSDGARDALRVSAAVLAAMAVSTLVYAAVRRSLPRVTGERLLSASAGATTAVRAPTACACSSAAAAASIVTIDRVVPEENQIEKRLSAETKALHAQAVERGEDTYIDPRTGFTVFTRLGQMRNLKCCGNRCRHCPYGHVNVQSRRSMTTEAAAAAVTATAAAAPTTSPAASADAAAAEASDASGLQVPPHSVVYTKTGDKGTSALFTGERRKKTDTVFEALGALDELSSHVGLARAMMAGAAVRRQHDAAMMDMLEAIQQELLNAGTVVATPTARKVDEETARDMTEMLDGYRFSQKTTEMERNIDVIDSRLVPLRVFILPGGGNVASAQLHVCRTVCRRAERRMIEVRDLYGEDYTDHLRQVTVYVNRLSDFLFVAARSVAEEDVVRKYD